MLKPFLELCLIAGLVYGGYHAYKRFTKNPASKTSVAVSDIVQSAPATLDTVQKTASPGWTPHETNLMNSIQTRFATGDFNTALANAEKAAADQKVQKSFRIWISQQMPVLLTSAGWANLRLGKCEIAIHQFRRALALKAHSETSKGLAICYFKQKNFIAASPHFSSYLQKQTDDDKMQALYADVLESEARYDEAVQVLEALAKKYGDGQKLNQGDSQTLNQRLASMRARAKESGLQRIEHSQFFQISYRVVDHDELVSYSLITLEDALDHFTTDYGFEFPKTPIEVVLYPADHFQNLVVGGPEWAEGLFDGRLRIPVKNEALAKTDFQSVGAVLRHELVHALLARKSDTRQLPPWLDEGLAQRLACAKQGCPQFRFSANPGDFLEIEMFQSPYITLPASQAGRSYQQSLYLVYVLEEEFGSDAIRRIIVSVSKTSRLDSNSILRNLGTDFAQLHTKASRSWSERRRLKPQ